VEIVLSCGPACQQYPCMTLSSGANFQVGRDASPQTSVAFACLSGIHSVADQTSTHSTKSILVVHERKERLRKKHGSRLVLGTERVRSVGLSVWLISGRSAQEPITAKSDIHTALSYPCRHDTGEKEVVDDDMVGAVLARRYLRDRNPAPAPHQNTT